MTEPGDPLPPIVIRRGDAYVVLNVDLGALFPPQRAALGVAVWGQVRTLMENNGEPVESPRSVDGRTAKAVGVGRSSVEKLRRAVARKPSLLRRVLAGEMTIAEATRAVGMKTARHPISKHIDTQHFRRGDRFTEGVEPLRRYLQPWKEKNFKFTHVPPREARRRLPILKQMAADLQQVIEDLEMRSHSARLSMPSEKEKKGDNG